MDQKDFAVDVAKYFMDFLETNFQKRRAPKRSYRYKNEKNLLVGVDLKKFPKFQTEIYKLAKDSFEKNGLSLKKGRHTQQISPIVLEIVAKYCQAINDSDLKSFADTVNEKIHVLFDEYTFSVDEAKEKITDLVKEEMGSRFLLPLLEHLRNPLKNKHSFDDDFLISIGNEMVMIFGEVIENLVSEFVLSKIVEKQKDVILDLQEVLSLVFIQEQIKKYFENLKVEDLFFEVGELLNNKEILDKQELYLYFYDIRFEGNIYPLFYIPVEAMKSTDSININLDSSIYINKKAIDFVVQKVNQQFGSKGKFLATSERIIYVSDSNGKTSSRMENIVNDFINYVQASGRCDLGAMREQKFKSDKVTISNNCYLAVFDKSDEALVNDYEELISLLNSGANILGDKFTNLISGFLKDEPIKVISEVENEWEGTKVSEKLVNVTPIPLNEEQNQIVRALKKKDCKYISVEGPPGTGKSHSITAIVFSYILEKKNVLVLSDKKEALDVVEDKITETLNSVRLSDEFQNPILRLGKSGNTYNQILSNTSILGIKNHFKAIEKNKTQLNQSIDNIQHGLRSKISSEINEYSKIKINEIIQLEQTEEYLKKQGLIYAGEEELLNDDSSLVDDLESIKNIASDLSFAFSDEGPSLIIHDFSKILKRPDNANSFEEFKKLLELLKLVYNSGLDITSLDKFSPFESNKISKISSIIARFCELRHGIFGYLFKGNKIAALLAELHREFDCPEITNLKKNYDILQDIESCIKLLLKECQKRKLDLDAYQQDLALLFFELKDCDIDGSIDTIANIIDDLREVEDFIQAYPKTAASFGLKKSMDIFSSKILEISETDFERFCYYLRLRNKIEVIFKEMPTYDYPKKKRELESLFTAQMTHELDSRVIRFFEDRGATAKTLKNIIKSKKKFPKEEFIHLKEAFPCIISGIRDYAEFIPLDEGLFDLVIIDEASQVSIAQALPALLRAKKVIVFGDKKQFSNIKSAHARLEINKQYLERVKSSYIKNRSYTQSELVRLAKFDIKTSVLDFFEYIGNYSIMLRKHFRGYRELISYSSKFFYSDGLQAIKIRGKKIEDVLEFVNIEHDGKLDQIENTNSLEIKEIKKHLLSLVKNNCPPSIGIITPHTNQQKVLVDNLMSHECSEDFLKKLKLKIMTFDTCQGEERDVIMYSMVANPASDKLGYVFIKDLASVDLDEDNKVRAQRLNVGFSRAKEKIIFFLSKPINDFSGEIQRALQHYQNTLNKAMELPMADDVDQKSPMEKKVLEWIQTTMFFKRNIEKIELKAQFAVGDYLKQLDPQYSHPRYVCDFLLLYRDEFECDHKIIIEYDGFKEHFTNLEHVNEYNYKQYYSDDDVFREKTLEGYGYKFIRINRFNIGKDPVETLNTRFQTLLEKKDQMTNPSFIRGIHNTVNDIEDGTLKECLKCGRLLPLVDFQDVTLSTGVGRYCMTCKNSSPVRKRDRKVQKSQRVEKEKINSNTSALPSPKCPKCNSPMTLRTGKYGKFWGCSKFPSCKGTKNYSEKSKKKL